jgi:hypothetical protein
MKPVFGSSTYWVRHFIQDGHRCQPQVSPQGPAAVCSVEWKFRHFPPWVSSCFLPLLPTSSLFPLDPDSCSVYVHIIYCSAAGALSPAAGFSTCESGGIRHWTSSVLMATLSGWSHLLKCSKVLGKSRRQGCLYETLLIHCLMISFVVQILPSLPPISPYNCSSRLTWGEALHFLTAVHPGSSVA